MRNIKLHIIRLFALLLMMSVSSAVNQAWAATVTYHILTLPINPSYYDYKMKDLVTGWRLEAVKVVVNNQTTVELPAQYKSPLATGFTYYKTTDVTKYNTGTAQNLFTNGPVKGVLYKINGVDADTEGSSTPVAEGTTISGNTAEYYVIYTYNSSNEIAQLDGSVKYNIRTKYKDNKVWKDRGFFALNRGRNNRPAVLPSSKVDPENLASEDFMKFGYNSGDKSRYVNDTKVSAYWLDNNNKNKEADVAGRFHFMFKFEGKDPYNIIIRTAYSKDTTYIEKNDGTNNFVYKWYKEASLFGVGSGNNCYIASDEHKRYTTPYNSSIPNPINPASENRPGNYHGQTGVVWNSVALLNNSDNSGYVFMGTRTVDGNGAINNTIYYLKQKDNCNNLNFASGNSSDDLSIEGIYPIKKLTFKVTTPFYDPKSPSDAHIISVTDQVSQYTVENDVIETKYLPDALKRKYCEFDGKFYKDAACTQEITKFSEAVEDPTEGYQVYVGYNVTLDAPKFLSPSDSYTTATWYELTDEGSTQEYGRKIKYDTSTSTYKNNGANGEFVKESEFALEGDPYEVKVLYRKGTETAGSKTYVTLSTHDTWDIPDDDTDGSFLLRKFNDTGYWSWDAGEPTGAVTYQSNLAFSADKDAQTITFNLSGLNGSNYYKITTGGTGASQIVSVSPRAGYVYKETATTATIAVSLAANTSGAEKTMTVTIQEYTDDKGTTTSGTASVITITQGTVSSSFAGNTVTYSTTNSTRVKLMELPTRTFTYKIVDKSGRIAVKASVNQAIFSTLSLASIPSIIVSPFLMGETVTFYDTYNGGGRGNLTNPITETPNVNHDIFVKYTTGNLDTKPIKLNETQEFNVVLNGQYVYCEKVDDKVVIKSKATPSSSEKTSKAYLWKLRNRDPYAMLIDNLGARVLLDVTGSESVNVYGDDGGTPTSESREKGAWVKVGDANSLVFTTTRTGNDYSAQQFIAKAGFQGGVYEVMLATGDGDGTLDASVNYKNIGRTSETEIKLYEKGQYAHGNSVLMFQLEQTVDYKYHLIDKYNHELLNQTSQSPDLVLPAEYQSPLVATYHYYDIDQFNVDGDVYTLKNNPTALTQMSDLDATFTKVGPADYSTQWESTGSLTATSAEDVDAKAKILTSIGNYYYRIGETNNYYYVNVTKPFYKDIYVTYDVNDRVKFNDKASPYMLKFLKPHSGGYFLEDGNDKLTSSKIQAVYPYCNGDGSLNVYGDDMQKEQFNGGASTRTRWTWFFESEKKDPYHVMIHSSNTITFKDVKHYTYLQTFAVDFVQGASTPKHIVTCGSLPSVGSEEITEYMVLGTNGQFKLRTTNAINDGTSTMRRDVTSLEQYWKTYNMIKLYLLEIDKNTDAYSTDESTWVVPTADDPSTDVDESTYRATLAARDWHSYAIYANAVRWNGYNDKSDGHEKKVVQKLEHWFQTFDMGDGTFDIENASIPPVLVLLDRHGWEIMRLPLPTENYPEGDKELAALRAYDSPMVDKYYFYSNATKATGCHKYSLRMQDGKERDQIKVDGVHYSSTSLGDLPPITATGVKSSGSFNDQYVIYTVKEEYAKSYGYTFTDNGDGTYSETETPSKFLIVQHGRYYKTETNENKSYLTKPVEQHTNPNGGNVYDMVLDPINHSGNPDIVDGSGHWIGNCLWYIKPNQNIDKEMGIKYSTTPGKTDELEPWTEFETKKYYYDNGKAGFDPYNLQIQLLKKNNGTDDLRYLTSHMTSTSIVNGIMVGNYSGNDYYGNTGSTYITLNTAFTSYAPTVDKKSEGYDHTNIQMSNQTFMAVSDANGNMQLMPRFDHTKRVDLDGVSPWETTLEDPVDHPKASASDIASMGSQTTFFVRSQVFEYKIINNSGKESLRYKRGGDYYPTITDHFKSPLAKDFTFYKGLAEHGETSGSTVEEWGPAAAEFKKSATTETLMNSLINLLPIAGTYYYRIGTKGDFSYKKVTVTKGLSEKLITGSFADAGLSADDCDVIVRYDYDADIDHDGDRILEGKWFTAKLANKDLKCGDSDVIETSDGTGVNLLEGSSKPGTIDEDDKVWQWKFLQAPTDPSSDYYEEPDPYDVRIFNRKGNYTTNPSVEPSPMAVGIKVPNEASGADHFALLSHTSSGYALAVAGTGLYTYKFVNGKSMTTSVAATTVEETDFTQKAGIFDGVNSQLLVNDDVKYNFTYKVINNGGADYVVDNPGSLAIEATQNNEAAEAHGFFPYLPEAAQTPLLNTDDYKYYGFARPDNNNTPEDSSDDTYAVIPQTILYTLYGLYDDVVWVRYGKYSMDNTEYKIPNKRTETSPVERHPDSHDVSININGELPYNIIWKNDNMMKSDDDTNITDAGNHDHKLDGDSKYVWYFKGNDPYAIEIEHKKTGYYINGTSTLVSAESGAKQFMLLKKSGYDYGVFAVTGDKDKMLSFEDTDSDPSTPHDVCLTATPNQFIIFGLSVHDLIYRLIIAKTCPDKTVDPLPTDQYVEIPYREGDDDDYTAEYVWTGLEKKRIYGTTQRDLTSVNTGEGTHYPGEKYQLGETISWGGSDHLYSHHAGTVSLGDDLMVPNIFYRPNCTFEYYIEGIYNSTGTTSESDLDNRFKGLKVDKLMTTSDLIDKTVVVNIVYKFNENLATNSGLGFVTSKEQNLWYTFETPSGTTPYLAHYTNAWGLQSMEGRDTRYTNDYLWTPLGDVYGFQMYNRYMIKNSGASDNVMTFAGAIEEGKNLAVAKPGSTVDAKTYTEGNEIFELVSGDVDGYFRVHPVINNSGTMYYVWRDPADDYTKLSTNPCDWTYGLDMSLLEPYYERAGYVGGLNATGKAAYKAEIDKGEGNYKITDLQKIVYNDANIVDFSAGYYRLHSVPGTPGIDPVRYASGYLHEIEKTAGTSSTAIPMHFYSKAGVTGTFNGDTNPLESGFTETAATRGDIPVPATEDDPSTIFYLNGGINPSDPADGVNPRVIMSTQGLYVKGIVPKIKVNEEEVDDPDHGNAVMTAASGEATKFSLIDIGGAVLLIANELAPATRNYLHYGQSGNKYDLKYYHNSPTNEARWCVAPADSLMVTTNNGGDDYYYSTFCAPFDVLLPDNVNANPEKEITAKDYYAYVCDKWDEKNLHPTKVPAKDTYLAGKFVPAGTPVIFRIKDESGSMKLTLPNASPSGTPLSCVFSGKYLEQLLGNGSDVYTLGLPFISDVHKDVDYNTTGDIVAPLPEQATSGLGFYINATANKEHNQSRSRWDKNNRYVLHNKIYYREPAASPAPQRRGPEFVPVIFDDEEGAEELNPDGSREIVGDGCVYDLMGRKVATREQVEDGSWKQRVATGIYILNGKKFQKK